MMTSPKIFFVEPPGPRRKLLLNSVALQRAKELGFSIRLNDRQDKLTEEQWADMLVGIDALITTWGAPRLNKTVLSKNTTLKIVGHAAGSVTSIVSPELYSRGVKVVSANYVMARSVAEWSLMMTIFSLRKTKDFTQFGINGLVNWEKRKSGKGMHDAVIGIWGFGDVAKNLIEFLRPFTPKQILVSGCDLTDRQAKQLGIKKVSFDELFIESDVIHLLASLTENTKCSVGAKQLGLIKNGASLINAGRAALVEPKALLTELEKKRFNVVLDVHYEEPLPVNSPFCKFDNVVLSPHSAGCGSEGLYIQYILDEFEKFFSNKPLKYEISQERAGTMTKDHLTKTLVPDICQ
jgi:phosphoglycerate dehydrogenase-like enzyme